MKKGTIIGFEGHPLSNLKYLILNNGTLFLDGNYALGMFREAFGSLKKAIGKEILYDCDWLNILIGFTPIGDKSG